MIRDVLIVLAGVLLTAGSIWRAAQLWKNSTADLDAWPVGVLRAFPTLLVMMILFLGFAALSALLTDGKEYDTAGNIAGILSGLALIVGVGLAISVGLRGRPRALVPPHLRHVRPPGPSRR